MQEIKRNSLERKILTHAMKKEKIIKLKKQQYFD